MDSTLTLVSLTTLIEGITAAGTWLFSLFTDFLGIITSNNVLLYLVLASIAFGSIGVVLSLIRKFGVRGRRR